MTSDHDPAKVTMFHSTLEHTLDHFLEFWIFEGVRHFLGLLNQPPTPLITLVSSPSFLESRAEERRRGLGKLQRMFYEQHLSTPETRDERGQASEGRRASEAGSNKCSKWRHMVLGLSTRDRASGRGTAE